MKPGHSNSYGHGSPMSSGSYYQGTHGGNLDKNQDDGNSGDDYYEDRPKRAEVAEEGAQSVINAHLRLARQSSSSRPIASCAVEALNMLLQLYKMPLPTFEFTTTRDAAGRSIFSTTVQVKNCIASAKEFNKKLCKQAVCHQLLINIHNRYPRLNIPIYQPPQTVLTKFSGNSVDICDLALEVGRLQLEEKNSTSGVKCNRHPQKSPDENLSKLSEMEKLSLLAKKFQGIQPPEYIDVSDTTKEAQKNQEVICKLGCEVVKGIGTTNMEAKKNSAQEMMKLLGQVEASASTRDFAVSSAEKETLVEAAPSLEMKVTQRKSNDYWAVQLKIDAYGAGKTQNESLISALEKVKGIVEETLGAIRR